MIKLAKNLKCCDDEKLDAQKIADMKNAGADWLTLEQMQAETGCKIGGKGLYFKVDEKYYRVKLNKDGNISDVTLFAYTFKWKENNLPKYEEVEEFITVSDAGGYLINGLLFDNNHGDGENTVEVRKFKNTDGQYHTAAEIYNNPVVFTPRGVLKIWGYDCQDVEKVAPIREYKNAFKVVVCGRKLIVCVA